MKATALIFGALLLTVFVPATAQAACVEGRPQVNGYACAGSNPSSKYNLYSTPSNAICTFVPPTASKICLYGQAGSPSYGCLWISGPQGKLAACGDTSSSTSWTLGVTGEHYGTSSSFGLLIP